jgi:DNA repair protein SbcD/Mre11
VPAYYSGSPLPLSFSERRDEKRVLLLETSSKEEPRSLPVPAFRSLLKISGSLEELQQKLKDPGSVKELDTLIEVELQEEDYDANKIYLLDQLVTDFDLPGFEIVKHRASFKNKISGAGEIYNDRQLEDLKPREVFMELIERHDYDDTTHREILGAFDELLEEVQQKENAG